ncbi:MAG: hypothetical protein ABSE42_22525 [Bryobacteraceae bacterium]
MAWDVGVARLDVDAGGIVLPTEDAAKAEIVEDLLLDVLFERIRGRLVVVKSKRYAKMGI